MGTIRLYDGDVRTLLQQQETAAVLPSLVAAQMPAIWTYDAQLKRGNAAHKAAEVSEPEDKIKFKTKIAKSSLLLFGRTILRLPPCADVHGPVQPNVFVVTQHTAATLLQVRVLGGDSAHSEDV
ncbi:hypothetical protein SARC_02367 [Sphaeroforma arctica JP610]|uniref:Uncharacterized protein n=1 Tax=Sphaeroforma arctica JP610 TaxID=667725 RepID=A0A0L0G8V4_9EUKA|nr:hypothetical protein SARC_02367 [Sphaeroforma arctica JP610]KNC85462.1 hypothetical protein SARC_02367 [Sphaeroforma arctica JP610]|eukprot:XP_014159364.1 hypothetical protein SARC_02367 [Sphaeroforma arctica JP610]